MEGTIVSFRRNRHTTHGNHMIIKIPNVSTREEATKLVGKIVDYDTGKKIIKGTVAAAHGNSGAVRAIFETGMPGQSLAQKVKIN